VEAIGGLIALCLFLALLNFVVNAGTKTIRALGRAATGKGSLSENMEAAFKGMGPLEVRFKDESIGADKDSLFVKELQVKGLFPISRRAQLEFVSSVFDDTSGEFEPVLSAIEPFQEPQTLAYQYLLPIGPIDPGVGLISWVRAGVLIPQLLETPASGNRKLVAILRLIDANNRPRITNGFHESNHPGLLWQRENAQKMLDAIAEARSRYG
jgi:hypothetical protein